MSAQNMAIGTLETGSVGRGRYRGREASVEGDVSKTRRSWEGTTMRVPVAREGIASTKAGGRSVTSWPRWRWEEK